MSKGYSVLYQDTYGDPADHGQAVISSCGICQALVLLESLDRHLRWHRTLTNKAPREKS